MPYPLPLTRTEAYLAYKAGVIQQSDLKPSLAVPRNGIDAWLAYWTGIAEDYPKREDGTPHILQEEEAYIAYLCGVLDEYPEKCLRRVGAYLRYIISARWGRPDHPLNREEFYLSLIKTQFIPSGDPSSDIEIDGTAKAPFVGVKMYGDTAQNSYTGKNRVAPEDVAQATEHGVTYSIEDGVISLDGTSGSVNNMSPVLFNLDGMEGNPAVSVIPISGSWTGGNIGFSFYDSSNNRVFFQQVTYDGRFFRANSLTAEQIAQISYCRVFFGATGVFSNFKCRIMLTKSTVIETDFEPYTGGTPSPNPDYPQPIQTVTGTQTVEIVGKNLFDKDNMDTRNGYLYRTIFSYRTTNADRTFIVPCEPNTTYTISRSVITSSFRAAYIDLEPSEIPADASSETSLTCVGYIANNSGTSITITTSATAKSLLVHYGNTNTDGVTLIGQSVATIMVEKSASTTAYAPYSKQTLPLDLGSIELCKLGSYQDYIWKDNGDWKVHKEISSITLDGTEGWVYADNYNYARCPSYTFADIPLDGTGTQLSNYFEAVADWGTFRDSTSRNAFFTLLNSGYKISIRNTDCTSVEDYISWFSTNKPSFYYPVETPTDTVITDQNLIDQLNALKQGGAEEGTTYIKVSATDPNLPAKLYVEAPKYD